ncbi:hypothetical protein KGY79_08570 [Candidatus Bipolaricaulota bacterium]|nr:hypothetical protein [Candidatus Bipolaricaulota bacterium]
MNSKERVITSLNLEQPDRVPIDLGGYVTGITKGAYRNLCNYLNRDEEVETLDVVQQLTYPSEVILKKLGVDTRYLFVTDGQTEEKKIEETPEGIYYTDGWGVKRKMSTNELYFDIVESPLASLSVNELRDYKFPDPENQRGDIVCAVNGFRKNYGETNFAIATQVFGTTFELSWYLRGFERFLKDLYQNREFAELLLDSLVDYWYEFFDILFEEAEDMIDIVMMGDDLATQDNLLLNPRIYREVVKPRQRKICSYLKNQDVYIFYHTCGAVRPLIGDLIDIGVDALNPVQVNAAGMDSEELKEEFGDRIAFWGGGIDTQKVMPTGSVEEVREEVKQRIDDLGPGGGFVFNPVHNIQADVPPENIVEAFATAQSYGKEVY